MRPRVLLSSSRALNSLECVVFVADAILPIVSVLVYYGYAVLGSVALGYLLLRYAYPVKNLSREQRLGMSAIIGASLVVLAIALDSLFVSGWRAVFGIGSPMFNVVPLALPFLALLAFIVLKMAWRNVKAIEKPPAEVENEAEADFHFEVIKGSTTGKESAPAPEVPKPALQPSASSESTPTPQPASLPAQSSAPEPSGNVEDDLKRIDALIEGIQRDRRAKSAPKP